ncbi:MAG: hypothetical protein NTX42_09835 [Methanothrix sp.]|nr:hypothetical protein [Methanothrix sp.]
MPGFIKRERIWPLKRVSKSKNLNIFETQEDYSVVYDKELGLFCYALQKDGAFFSSKLPLSKSPPPDLEKHLQEEGSVRLAKAEQNAKRK